MKFLLKILKRVAIGFLVFLAIPVVLIVGIISADYLVRAWEGDVVGQKIKLWEERVAEISEHPTEPEMVLWAKKYNLRAESSEVGVYSYQAERVLDPGLFNFCLDWYIFVTINLHPQKNEKAREVKTMGGQCL